MKFTILLLIWPLMAFANKKLEVPFADLGQKILINVEKSRCTASGEKAYQLETVRENQEYSLVCKLRPPVDQYDSKTPIRLLENFEYPKTVLAHIDSNPDPELKKLGSKAIRTSKHSWGTEYTWSNRNYGTEHFTYLCPKKSKHCFHIIHGGIESLNFEVQKK